CDAPRAIRRCPPGRRPVAGHRHRRSRHPHSGSRRLRNPREWHPGVMSPNDEGDAMRQVPLLSAPEPYALATGEAADYRLCILHGLYGPGTRRVLLEAGLRPGMRAADLGCGVGMVTALLAELVGPEGHVVGIDSSGAQLVQARERLNAGGMNAR